MWRRPIENLAGGVFDFETGGLWAGVSTATFRNAGLVRKSGSGGAMAIIGYPGAYPILFENTGTVEVQNGTLRFNSSGQIDGSYFAASGAVIEFAGGNHTVGNPVTGGPGITRFVGNTLTLTTDLVPGLSLAGGTLYLGPAFQGGTITNLNLNGVTLGGTNTITGTATLSGGGIQGPLTIASSGVLNCSGGLLGGGGPTLVRGLFNWMGGDITGPLTVAANGVINASWNGLTTITGALTNAGLIRLLGYGQFNLAGGPIENLAGAVIEVQGGGLWAGVPSATFRNAGTFRKAGGAGLTTIGYDVADSYPLLMENSGRIEVETGLLRFNSVYSESSSAVVAISLGGTVPSSDFGRIHFARPLPLAGTFSVSVRNGFQPNASDTFPVLTYPSSTNLYTCLNGLDLGNGILLAPQFTRTELTLMAGNYALNGRPTLFVTRYPGGALLTWPLGFPNWLVQSTTNLNAPDWTRVAVNPQCGHQAIITTTDPQRYFRLSQ